MNGKLCTEPFLSFSICAAEAAEREIEGCAIQQERAPLWNSNKGSCDGNKGPQDWGGVRGLFIVSCTGALKVLVMPLSNYVS